MEEVTLNFIFNGVINEIRNSGLPERGQYIKELEVGGQSRRKIVVNYDEIREDIRKKCMDPIESILLDRHKCAASFMIAVLNYLDVEESNLSKEYFAMFVGLTILKLAISKEGKLLNNYRIINHVDAEGFKYPKCIRDNEPYQRIWALSIHYGRLSGRLSVLSVANSLFWIERHNRDLVDG